MKIAIFENEFEQFKGAFEAVNLFYFNGKMKYEVFAASQELPNERIHEFDFFIVDIGLSPRSQLDGYGLINKIQNYKPNAKIVVMTGNSKVSEHLKFKNINPLPIILKPVNFEDIYFKLMELES